MGSSMWNHTAMAPTRTTATPPAPSTARLRSSRTDAVSDPTAATVITARNQNDVNDTSASVAGAVADLTAASAGRRRRCRAPLYRLCGADDRPRFAAVGTVSGGADDGGVRHAR